MWRLCLAALALLLVAAAVFLPQRAPLADAASLSYARSYGGTVTGDNAVGMGIAVDAAGRAYLTGVITGTVDMDPGAGTSNFIAIGPQDGFVARLDANGANRPLNLQVNGTNTDAGAAITVDGAGASYATGTYNHSSGGNRDQAYAVKQDTNGAIVWIKFLGGTGTATGRGIAVDGAGSVYLSGSFSGEVDFDPNAGFSLLTSAGAEDVFVVKLDNSGNLLWVRKFASVASDLGLGIAVDGNGSVYVTGNFTGTVDFDPGGGTTNLTSAGSRDAFVVKLSTSGDLVWAKAFGGGTNDIGAAIAVDGAGAVYVTGTFQGTSDFDPGPAVFNLTSEGGQDAFTVKLDSSGGLVWAKAFSGPAIEAGAGIAVDAAGNVYVSGAFTDAADFDPSFVLVLRVSAGSTDAFVAKLNTNGEFVWVEVYGGAGDDIGTGVAVDSVGSVYATGGYSGTVDFDLGPGTTTLTSNPGDPTAAAAYVVKLVQTDPPVNLLQVNFQTTVSDTPLVFSTANNNRITVLDGDNGSSPLRVTLTVNSGTLTLNTLAGLTFTVGDGAQDATMTFTGTLSAINTALDGLTYTPVVTANNATLQITTLDLLGPSGGQTDTDSMTIQLRKRPVAVNDGYTVNTGATLTVPAATGLLANDTDADAPTSELEAYIVTNPTRGTVTLQTDGSFTYKPTGNSGGTDTFTYDVADPHSLASNTATVTITVNAVACGPRPSVVVTNSIVNGALEAKISVSEADGATQNRLQSITFGTLQNAQATLNGAAISSGQTVQAPSGSTNLTLTVRRATPGQATTVPFTVVDSCGSWPSFVGGGPGAGF